MNNGPSSAIRLSPANYRASMIALAARRSSWPSEIIMTPAGFRRRMGALREIRATFAWKVASLWHSFQVMLQSRMGGSSHL